MGHWREERFLTVTRQFYHDSHGDLIVYCIDDRSRFDKVNSWIIDLKNNAPEDSVIMIVGNKSDLNYKVESEEAKNFAEKINVCFMKLVQKMLVI